MTRFEELISEVEKIDPEAAKYVKSLDWLTTEDANEDYADDTDLLLSDLFLFNMQPQGHDYWETIADQLLDHFGWSVE